MAINFIPVSQDGKNLMGEGGKRYVFNRALRSRPTDEQKIYAGNPDGFEYACIERDKKPFLVKLEKESDLRTWFLGGA